MKTFKKVSALALSAFLTFGVVGCNEIGMTGGGNNDQYQTPVVQTYDNKAYNEYLMGDQTVIPGQWEGYGIGDPFIMRYNGTYYLYSSTLDSETGVRAYKSADLVNWSKVTGEGLPEGYVSTDPVTKACYAPEVYYYNGTFYMYTSPAGAGHYILTASSPEGPFVKATNNFGLSIDGSVLIDDDENMYFTYASSGGIRMAKMNDMLDVDGTSTPQLANTSIGGWTEGSYILKRDGIYYLTYTGVHVASDGYRIAYATADEILNASGNINRNAWTRAANNPMALETEGEFKGLGHSSTVMGPDMDSYYLAYHMLNSAGGPNRSLGIDRLLFNGKMMSVQPTLTGSVTPALPQFYALGADEQKFDQAEGALISKEQAQASFTAEFNLQGAEKAEYAVAYQDAQNYTSVTVDLAQKSIVLAKVENGQATEVATGTLVKDYAAEALHTVRVSYRNGVMDVVFDNMTKIDNAEIALEAGKIGYISYEGATVGYTAFSNVAMGMSDQKEFKNAQAMIGASNYVEEAVYNEGTSLSAESGLELVEDYYFEGAYSMTLGKKGDYASYLVNFTEGGRYGLELTYRTEDGGKTVGVELTDGVVYKVTLPEVATEEAYVTALVCEFEAEGGGDTVRLECLAEEFNYIALSFTPVSAVAPSYENSLENYAENGADYKTIWKIKDGGHYAKAGTRQLVYFGDETIADFTLEVDIKLEGNTGTSTAGLVFHAGNYAASSHDNYTSLQGYYIAFNNNQTVLEKLNYADGTTRIGNSPVGVESDQFVTVKIQVRANNIAIWLGGEQIVNVSDAYAYTTGKIGLYTDGAAVVFRNLKISA